MLTNQLRTSSGLQSQIPAGENISDEIRFHLRTAHGDASTAICFPPFIACPYESVSRKSDMVQPEHLISGKYVP